MHRIIAILKIIPFIILLANICSNAKTTTNNFHGVVNVLGYNRFSGKNIKDSCIYRSLNFSLSESRNNKSVLSFIFCQMPRISDSLILFCISHKDWQNSTEFLDAFSQECSRIKNYTDGRFEEFSDTGSLYEYGKYLNSFSKEGDSFYIKSFTELATPSVFQANIRCKIAEKRFFENRNTLSTTEYVRSSNNCTLLERRVDSLRLLQLLPLIDSCLIFSHVVLITDGEEMGLTEDGFSDWFKILFARKGYYFANSFEPTIISDVFKKVDIGNKLSDGEIVAFIKYMLHDESSWICGGRKSGFFKELLFKILQNKTVNLDQVRTVLVSQIQSLSVEDFSKLLTYPSTGLRNFDDNYWASSLLSIRISDQEQVVRYSLSNNWLHSPIETICQINKPFVSQIIREYIALKSWEAKEKALPMASYYTKYFPDSLKDLTNYFSTCLIDEKRSVRNLSALILTNIEWVPATDADKILYFLASEKKNILLSERYRQMTKRVFLEQMQSGDNAKIKNVVYGTISMGWSAMLPDLGRILNEFGDKAMAEVFLNCGNAILHNYADVWAKQHGYSALESPGGINGRTWGSW